MSSSQIRKDIFDNIRASEINYVTMLQYIVEEFIPSLFPYDSVLQQAFDGLEDIIQYHLAMRDMLKLCNVNWYEDEQVAYAFIAALCNDKVCSDYKRFIANFKPALDVLNRKLQTQTKLKKLFIDAESRIPGHLGFIGIIVKPVQRFPQYILYIQNLLQYMDSSHIDYSQLHEALVQLTEITQNLNEGIPETRYRCFFNLTDHKQRLVGYFQYIFDFINGFHQS